MLRRSRVEELNPFFASRGRNNVCGITDKVMGFVKIFGPESYEVMV
jgi:hypothetical protein